MPAAMDDYPLELSLTAPATCMRWPVKPWTDHLSSIAFRRGRSSSVTVAPADLRRCRDGAITIFTPHYPGLPGEHRLGKLRQRDGFSGSRRQVGMVNVGNDMTLIQRLAQNDVDQLVCLAKLADRRVRQDRA